MVSVAASSFNRKVAIIGAGYVGASIAYSLMLKELAREIILIDTNANASDSEMMDIRHGIPYMGSATIYSGTYADTKDCDLIIITAGRNRRPNETRLDMAADNMKIADGVVAELKKHYTRGVVLVVSNPVDIITYKVNDWMGLPAGMVFGTGCILDSSRFVNVIADYIGIGADVVNAQIIGEHGASQIALWSKVTVAGIPIKEYCETVGLKFDDQEKYMMEQRILNMGTEIIKGKGKTHYGIATCVCYIADAILNRRATIASVSSILNGEYGIHDIALSLPCIINFDGVERRLEDKLEIVEFQRLIQSSKNLKDTIRQSKSTTS